MQANPQVSDYVIIYECQWLEMKKNNERVRDFMANKFEIRKKTRLIPRDALSAGLTENYNFLYNQEDEKDVEFYYKDIVSLYPHLAMSTLYPVGDPQILVGPVVNDIHFIHDRFCLNYHPLIGIAEVKVVFVPPNLDRPILSIVLENGKRVYGNCKKCAKDKQLNDCQHHVIDMSWDGVYTFDELEAAALKGYQFQFLEAWVYEDRANLFGDFIKILAVEKLKASKIPVGVTEADYCLEINRSLNLTGNQQIRCNDIKYDFEHREFLKFCLNSFLGKLGQKNDYITSEFAYDHRGILLKETKAKEIWNIQMLNSSVCQVFLRNRKYPPINLNSNSILYAIITARSRLFMLEKMDELENAGCKIFSISTDGVAFSMPKSCTFPSHLQGFTFGKFQDEHTDITHYSSLGPKNYCIVAQKDGQRYTTLKVSGLSISIATQNVLNQRIYKDAVEKWLNSSLFEIKVPQSKTKVSLNNPFAELLRVTYYDRYFRNNIFKKRAVVRHQESLKFLTTRPYGYTYIQILPQDYNIK